MILTKSTINQSILTIFRFILKSNSAWSTKPSKKAGLITIEITFDSIKFLRNFERTICEAFYVWQFPQRLIPGDNRHTSILVSLASRSKNYNVKLTEGLASLGLQKNNFEEKKLKKKILDPQLRALLKPTKYRNTMVSRGMR